MLPARFHTLRDRTLAQVDKFRAEPVFVSFLKKDGTADETREAVTIEAILRVQDGKDASVSGGRDRDWRSSLSAQRAELLIDRAKYSGLRFRVRDKVRALARPGQPWFEILSIDDRSHSRLALTLGES